MSITAAPTRMLLPVTTLPYDLYRAAQVRALDQYIIQQQGIPGTVLMERAGTAAWQLALEHWPAVRNITVLCGTGNNGGDGYVLARQALQAGCTVQVLQLGAAERLSGDALVMAQRYLTAGGKVYPYQGELPIHTDLLVDAVLGTGLEREVSGLWAKGLKAMNQHPAPKLALDIPSGLNADTGHIMGSAVQAQLTVTFIALKQGLFTADGPDCCGKVCFAGLDVPAAAYDQVTPAAQRMDWQRCQTNLSPRRRGGHKGNFGHVLLVGGAPGMGGALRLAGEAAARCGAGLVTLATHPKHGHWLSAQRPELMCHGVENAATLGPLLERATVVAIGPGLGLFSWSRELLDAVLLTTGQLVLDADALHFLAVRERHYISTIKRDHKKWILTPHPGEAGRLLGWPTAQVQRDRFTALQTLRENYNATVVLKGAGTLIQGITKKPPTLCNAGNPGMASGGMGDLLTGIIAGLLAQGWGTEDAANMGVCLHAAAGDLAARAGERGLLASDLLVHLRSLLNPEATG